MTESMTDPQRKGGWTPGPWEYVPGTEDHGPYITSDFGTSIADCYMMARPSFRSPDEGGPINFMAEMAEPNARLIAAAPELYEALARADQFITNGIELGFIRMPDLDCPDPALATPGIIRAALAKAKASPDKSGGA